MSPRLRRAFGLCYNVAAGVLWILVLASPSSGQNQNPLLGINIRPIGHPDTRGLTIRTQQGAVIIKVFPGSPAQSAGLKAGDVIVKCGTQLIGTDRGLKTVMIGYERGQRVRFEFYRGASRYYTTVTLAKWTTAGIAPPSSAPRPPSDTGTPPSPVTDNRDRAPLLGAKATSAGTHDALALGVESPTGAVILRTHPGEPAARAGLRRGDLVVRFGDAEIQCVEDLQSALRHSSIGSRQRVVFVRGADRYAATLTIGSKPIVWSWLRYTHQQGGYRFELIDGWTSKSIADQPDAIISTEGNYRLICFANSWAAANTEQSLTEFASNRFPGQPKTRVVRCTVAGTPGVYVGYSSAAEGKTVWRIAWVHLGRRYVINATGPPLSDPARLPAPIIDILSTIELLKPDATAPDPAAVAVSPQPTDHTPPNDAGPTVPTEPSHEPPQPPDGWIVQRAGNVRLYLPPKWQASPYATADEGRWLFGEEFAPNASFALLRDQKADDVTAGMTTVSSDETVVAGHRGRRILVEVEEAHRTTRGMIVSINTPGPAGGRLLFTAYCDADEWPQFELLFEKIFTTVSIDSTPAGESPDSPNDSAP